MDLTRRRIVALGAALPLVGLGVEAIAAAPSAPAAPSIYPLGTLVDTYEVWDGQRFVRFDSAEGAAVLNRLLQGRA